MEYRKFPQGYALRLDPGEEVVDCLTRLAEQENVQLGTVSALGAANDVTIGIFNTEEKNTTPGAARDSLKFPPWWGM